MIKFIPKARRVALKSQSLWATRAGIAALVLPEIWFAAMGYDIVTPLARWTAGLGLLFLAEFLRYVDQGGLDR